MLTAIPVLECTCRSHDCSGHQSQHTSHCWRTLRLNKGHAPANPLATIPCASGCVDRERCFLFPVVSVANRDDRLLLFLLSRLSPPSRLRVREARSSSVVRRLLSLVRLPEDSCAALACLHRHLDASTAHLVHSSCRLLSYCRATRGVVALLRVLSCGLVSQQPLADFKIMPCSHLE